MAIVGNQHRKFSGKRLKEHRKAKKMGILSLCKAIEFAVGPGAINDYEKGRSSPNVNVMLRIAEVLKVKPGDLTE